METNLPGAPLLPGHEPKQAKIDPAKYESAFKPVKPAEDFDEPDPLNHLVDEPGDPDGVVAAEQLRAEQAAKQAQQTQPVAPKPTKKKRRWPLVLLFVLLLAAATAGSYWYGSYKASAPEPASQSGPKATTNAQSSQPKTETTKHYDSTNFTLGFDYPSSWTETDTTDQLTIASPSVELTQADGSKQNGRVVVTIQNQQTTLPGYPADGAVTTVASDKLQYAKPTPVQRAATYLSYLSYDQSGGLDALFLTGDNGYQASQQVPLTDVTKGNPLVSVKWVACTTNDCALTSQPKMLSLKTDSWQSSDTSKTLVRLIESLQLN